MSSGGKVGKVGVDDSELAIPIPAAPPRSEVLAEYWLAAVPLVSDLDGRGCFRPRAFIYRPSVSSAHDFPLHLA